MFYYYMLYVGHRLKVYHSLGRLKASAHCGQVMIIIQVQLTTKQPVHINAMKAQKNVLQLNNAYADTY